MTPTPHRAAGTGSTGLRGTLRRMLSLSDDAPIVRPLLLIGGAAAALCGSYAFATGWLTPQRLTPTHVLGAFKQDFGVHPGYRRNHAKGLCVAGYFEGNGKASALSTAAVFDAQRTEVIGRFAIPGGNPMIADAKSPVRSMALLFKLPHGEQWRSGMNNTPMFSVSTPQAFYEQLLAGKPDPQTGKPDPQKMKAFFDAHPETANFRAWIKAHPPSSSLANGAYYSINAFELVDSKGVKHAVRWAMVPELAYAPVGSPPPGDPNFLAADLSQKLQQGPLRWHLILTLAAPGDPTDNATKSWPADRPTIDAGTLTLEREVPQSDGPCRDVNYDPTVLPQGIATSDDPLLAARSAAYSASFNTRTREEALGTHAPADAHPKGAL